MAFPQSLLSMLGPAAVPGPGVAGGAAAAAGAGGSAGAAGGMGGLASLLGGVNPLMAGLGIAGLGTSIYGMFQQQKAQKKAMEMWQQQVSRARGLAAQMGKSGRRRINEQFAQRGGQLQTSLARRGLSASTAAAAGERILGTDRERALGELSERVAGLRMGVETGAGMQLPQAFERMAPQYPSLQGGLSAAAAPFMLQAMMERQGPYFNAPMAFDPGMMQMMPSTVGVRQVS